MSAFLGDVREPESIRILAGFARRSPVPRPTFPLVPHSFSCFDNVNKPDIA